MLVKIATIGIILICSNIIVKTQPNTSFKIIQLGGPNISDEIFNKRYRTDDVTEIQYSKWDGVEVNSNKQLKLLLKEYPNCEAIKFNFWSHDESMNFNLSQDIGQFKNLKFLEIHCNRILKYPKEIENLLLLEELVLEFGLKSEIEFDFSRFNRLRHLTLHGSGLKLFPFSIFNCLELETLKLNMIQSSEADTLYGIQNLSNLKELDLWASNLYLPDKKFNFDKLETLIINRYGGKPNDEIYNLKSLKKLVLHSRFDTLSFNSLSKLNRLEYLYLSHQKNFIGILNLPNLEHLELIEFHGSKINIEIGKLKSLKSIVVRDCDNLDYLFPFDNTNLKSIKISNNDRLKKINFVKDKLIALEEIMLGYNDVIIDVPERVNNVKVKIY